MTDITYRKEDVLKYIDEIIKRNTADNVALTNLAVAIEWKEQEKEILELFLKRRDIPGTSLEEIHLVTHWMLTIRKMEKEDAEKETRVETVDCHHT